MDLYTQSFNIPAGGWTGQASGLLLGLGASTAVVTIQVKFWRDSTPSFITLRPGELLPFKVRWVNHNTTLAGFN